MADADFNVKAIISAQTSQFEKGMKNAQSSVNSLSSSISNITNLVKKAFAFTGVAIGTKAIVDFGKSCVQSANQAVKTFNILDNTVKATGADAWTSIENLESASKALSDSTNYSVTEIQKMQSVLLGFTNITGEAFDGASEAVLDMATVMGMDLTSAVQTVGKALDDPVSGLDSLRRQGFKFTDEQKAELTQLVKNGKQFEAQKIILDTLATSYGGASKAGQDSFAKQRHAIENFNDTLGAKLIPVMQVFAEKNANMINSLRELIENIDFTPVINVVTNLKKIFTETFNTISGYLRNVGAYVSDFISRFNFKPIISILDTLIGVLAGVISKFKEINSQKLEIFDKLKESLVDFSNLETFQNIVNFVNKIIDAVFFLWSEVQDIGMEIRDLVVNKIVEIWNKIKELFQNSQNALSESGQDIASWGDLFYNILNNAFRSFQDFFGMIKALIHGDWTVAWEYAKLTVMRVADNILDLISTIANAFPNLINGMIEELNKLITEINKVRGWFGKDPLGLISAFESVDLSKKSGLEDKIKEAENKIQELTGKSADITIQNLEGVSTKFAGFTQHALGEIEKLTEGVAQETEKQKMYFSSMFSTVGNDTDKTFKKFSEWDSKLLQQRLENLSKLSGEAHKINLQLIEEERKKALEADKTGADTEKINSYYNKAIEQENKRHIKAILVEVGSVVGKITGVMKNIASTIISGLKGIFGAFRNIGAKLFDFNIDDALDNLLVFEDKILTFFIETLPRLPQFFASAFQSIVALLETIFESVDFEKLLSSLVNSVTKILKDIPKLIVKAIPKVIKVIGTLFKEFKKLLPELIKAFEEITQGLFEVLPDFFKVELPAFLNEIASFIPTILKAGSEFIKIIVSALPGIIQAIIDAFILLLQNPKEIADLAVAIVKGFVEVIMVVIRNIGPLLKALLPAIATIIIEIFKALPELLWSLTKELGSMILEVGKWVVNLIIDGINVMLDGISKAWTWIPGTKGIPHIPHFANGTNDAPRGLALVGEYGPELVKFNGGEQVLNAHNTQKALAGNNNSGNTWNITFNNTKDTSAFTMLQQLKQYNRQMAINGIF